MVIRIRVSLCNNAVACIITQIDSACLPKKFYPDIRLGFLCDAVVHMWWCNCSCCIYNWTLQNNMTLLI